MEQTINLIIRKVLFRDSRMARGTWQVKDRHKERKGLITAGSLTRAVVKTEQNIDL